MLCDSASPTVITSCPVKNWRMHNARQCRSGPNLASSLAPKIPRAAAPPHRNRLALKRNSSAHHQAVCLTRRYVSLASACANGSLLTSLSCNEAK